MLKNKDSGAGTDTLFQKRAAKNRDDSLKATAVDVVIQSIDVSLEFQNRHIKRIANHHRIAQIYLLFKSFETFSETNSQQVDSYT